MVYIMLDTNSNNQFFVKVGQSRKPSIRRKFYKTHSPTAQMSSVMAGTESAEKKYKKKLEKIAIKRLDSSEWFEVSEEVYKKIEKQGFKFLEKF